MAESIRTRGLKRAALFATSVNTVLYYNRTPVAGLGALVARYGSGALDSPTRSTVPLIALLRQGDVWRRLVADLGLEPDETEVHLEYTVAPPQGRGGVSHTDAMLIAGRRACAVEAKWTEPPYPTVKDWLVAARGSINRSKVLDGWLALLRPYASRELHADDFSDVAYQVVHRAASACAVTGSPSCSYLLFTPRPGGSPAGVDLLQGTLEVFASALGRPTGFPLRLIVVEARPTPAFEHIRALPKGEAATEQAVRRALLGEPIFSFPEYRVHNVGGGFR